MPRPLAEYMREVQRDVTIFGVDWLILREAGRRFFEDDQTERREREWDRLQRQSKETPAERMDRRRREREEIEECVRADREMDETRERLRSPTDE